MSTYNIRHHKCQSERKTQKSSLSCLNKESEYNRDILTFFRDNKIGKIIRNDELLNLIGERLGI